MGFRCVHCGSLVEALYIQYSPGNIRLTKCPKCKAVADEYIEAEPMIVFTDLVLHKTNAYRHLFFNLPYLNKHNNQVLFIKAASTLFLLDACRELVLDPLNLNSESSGSSTLLLFSIIKVLSTIFLSNVAFFCTALLTAKIVRSNNETSTARASEICMALLFSSYFKLFFLSMMVWEFPSLAVFIVDAFVFSSNAVSMKAISNFTNPQSIAVSLFANAAKFFTSYLIFRANKATVSLTDFVIHSHKNMQQIV